MEDGSNGRVNNLKMRWTGPVEVRKQFVDAAHAEHTRW